MISHTYKFAFNELLVLRSVHKTLYFCYHNVVKKLNPFFVVSAFLEKYNSVEEHVQIGLLNYRLDSITSIVRKEIRYSKMACRNTK